MMKPKLVDVVQYVKDGQDDPKMRDLLKIHPDGRELLKQARFICKMLENEASRSDNRKFARPQSKDSGPVKEAAAMRLDEPQMAADRSEVFYQLAPLRASGRKRRLSRDQLMSRIESSGQELGTLTFEDIGEQVVFAFEPSDAAASKQPVGQIDLEGIQIVNEVISISVPSSAPKGESVNVRITLGAWQGSARDIQLVFMPDRGPFQELRVDDVGLVAISGPVRPGMLRIATPIVQILHIRPKNKD